MWSIFRALKRSWAQHFISQASGLVILTLTYSAVVFIALSLTNIQSLFKIWGQVSQVTVYLSNQSNEQDKEKLSSYLKSHELVESLKLVTSAKAAESFKERFKVISSKEMDSKQMSQFFPEFYEVNLVQAKAYGKSSQVLDTFSSVIKQKFSLVSSVSYGKSWLKRYISILSSINNIGWGLIGLFLMGALVVSSSVIKTILFDKKEEIEILEFVGADDFTIYIPQVLSVILTSVVSFLTAVLINGLFFHLFTTTDSFLANSYMKAQLHFLPTTSIIAMMVVSVVSLTLYSMFTIYRMMPRQRQASVGQS